MNPLSVGDLAGSAAECLYGCSMLLDGSVSTLTLPVAYDMVHCSPLHVRIGGGTAKCSPKRKVEALP